MADSQQTIDWDAIRRAANDCLNAAWSLVCFAELSQGSEYDANRATAHREAIDRARETFRLAMEILQPGLDCASGDSIRYSPVFDALALATAGRSDRPDFQYGPACCATAHEAAFELLRWAILWVENGLNVELDERGLPDPYVAGIDDLFKLSPEVLRDTLVRLERRESLQGLVRGRGIRQIRAWIDREWAVVSGGAIETLEPVPPQYLDITIGGREADQWTASRNGKTADFRGHKIPWSLFCRILRARGQVVRYAELLKEGWTEDDVVIEDNLRSHITTIRNLITPLGLGIKTHRRHGYSLCCTELRDNQI